MRTRAGKALGRKRRCRRDGDRPRHGASERRPAPRALVAGPALSGALFLARAPLPLAHFGRFTMRTRPEVFSVASLRPVLGSAKI